MKKSLFLFSFLVLAAFGFGQITLESGAQLIVSSGSTVIANDGIVSNDGSINNAGTIEIKGDLENNSSFLTTTGSTGTIKFNGSAAQEITGDADAVFYGTVEVDNSTGVSITGAHQTINGTLDFTDGLLSLNAFDLTLANAATGAGDGKYVQTNSTGVVTRNVPATATNVVYPVGNGTYNPIILQNSATATADDYSVLVVDDEPAGATAHFVDRSWVVTEGTAGGSELTVTPQWNVTPTNEELTDFDRTNASVGLTTNSGTDYEWTGTSAATGSDPYYLSGSTFTGVGTFAVGDYFNSGKRLALKLFLAGAFNGTTMNKDLNTGSLIPMVDPYGISPDAPSIPADAVDWVHIQLRTALNNSTTDVAHEFSCFVDIYGNLLETDGTSGLNMTGFDISTLYYVAVLHRNHFGVVSAATVDMDVASPAYDYTTAMNKAWDKSTVTNNDAMRLVSSAYCLWEGDANGNGNIVYNGGSSDRALILDEVGGVSNMTTVISNVYDLTDINMNGNIVYNGGSSDRALILDNVGGVANMTTVLSAHLP